MTRKLLLSFALFASAVAGFAQTTTITAANTQGSDGNKIGAGTITFRATDLLGNPFFGHQSGLVIPKAIVCLLVNGAITGAQAGGSCTLVDTSSTTPAHFCYLATIYDSVGRWTAPPIACLQPTGSTWSLDSYVPVVPTAIYNIGPVGPAGPTGNTGPQGPSGGADGVTEVDPLTGSDMGAKLSACMTAVSSTYGGSCDARGFTTAQTIGSALTISASNVVVWLPCTTITTAQQLVISPGVRNTTIHGCAYQGGSNASGTAGGTVWVYTGSGAAVVVGDSTYAQDTKGFRLDNINFNTASAGTSATVLSFYRVQEIDLRSVYLNGNQSTGQTGIYLDGTGNYTGGTFDSDTLNGFGTGVYMTGHLSGSVVGDYANASTFTRLHVVCPTSGNNPIAGTYGVNIAAADGNTWSGGDIENCSTMFHLGANAVNNTIVGLRNENSTIQYQADSGSTYNAVITGGTLFTGQLVDNGSRNSFWDAFHRTANGMNGDWYASQKDATVVNHMRLGIGSGTVRGLQWESQVDVGTSSSQYNWLWGLTDGASGASNWIFQDILNNAIRLQIGQLNTAGGNNATALNGAGTGNVCFQCSTNSGTGGVAFASGGATPSTVGTIDSSGNQTAYGYHRFYASGSEAWRFNCASASACNIDSWTTGSGVHHLRMYNGSGTEIDSEGSSAVVINNTSTGGTGGLIVYEGGANSGVASLTVDGSGNSTVAHDLVVTNHVNQAVTKDFAGSCSMSSATSCTFSINSSYTSTPLCFASVQNATAGAGSCVLSGTTVTITAANSSSSTWGALLIGNPN